MLEYGASAPEYKYDDSKGLSFHDKTISLLYIPGHYQIIHTKSTIESNTVLDKYDDIDLDVLRKEYNTESDTNQGKQEHDEVLKELNYLNTEGETKKRDDGKENIKKENEKKDGKEDGKKDGKEDVKNNIKEFFINLVLIILAIIMVIVMNSV